MDNKRNLLEQENVYNNNCERKMKMTKKQLQFDRLLTILRQNSDYITAKSLSEQLKLSEKTVYRLVKEINQNSFPDELIIKKRGRGLKLNKLKNYDTFTKSKQIDFTPASRQLQILERLLTISPKKLLIYDLAQEYYVSDSVIMKDKIEIQKQLNPFHLKISTRTGYIFITGSELDIRRALADLVPTFSMIDIEDLSSATNQSHFDLELARIILEEISQIEMDLQAKLPYPYNVNIFSHLYIMLERLKISNHKIDNSDVVNIKIKDYDEAILKESQKIINNIGNRLGRKINDLEINYLYQYLYSSRFQLNTYQQKVTFSTRVISVTKFYLKKMEMMQSKTINEQSPMFIDLANHISPLLRRLDNKIYIKNNMLDDIKARYSDIFNQTENVSLEMVEQFGFSMLSADEIGFLTLYFARFKELNQTPIKVVVMCSSGIGISELLKVKIETTFQNLDIVEVVSSQNIKDILQNHPDIQLVITSVSLPEALNVKTILVSALLTDEDKNNIQSAIREINYGS